MDETLTQKQREAVEALDGARRAGVSLTDYAKAKGLELRPVYDAIASLRRRGPGRAEGCCGLIAGSSASICIVHR